MIYPADFYYSGKSNSFFWTSKPTFVIAETVINFLGDVIGDNHFGILSDYTSRQQLPAVTGDFRLLVRQLEIPVSNIAATLVANRDLH